METTKTDFPYLLLFSIQSPIPSCIFLLCLFCCSWHLFSPFSSPLLLHFGVFWPVFSAFFQISAGVSNSNSSYKGRGQGEELTSILISSLLQTQPVQSAAVSLAEGEGRTTPWTADSKGSRAQISLQLPFSTLPDHYVKQQECFTPEPAIKGTAVLTFKC